MQYYAKNNNTNVENNKLNIIRSKHISKYLLIYKLN